jgi:uncharacterized protein (DUF427 family)
VTHLPAWARAARVGWRWSGAERPPFAVEPQEGQESVWDYPRPPRLQRDGRRVVVRAGDVVVAESTRALRVLETASPPTFYLPPEDVATARLRAARGSSRCEWKGAARYWDLVLPDERLEACAWSYADPFPGFAPIRGWFSFYPARLECCVGDARVAPQPGGFYGGWITPELVGPFKGEPGSEGW